MTSASTEPLQRLRDADEAAALAVFDELTQVLADIMPGWKIHQNFVAPVLRAAGLDFSQVAYVNLLKWRTKASSGLARLYALSLSGRSGYGLAPQVGLEPTTLRLTAECSTIELLRSKAGRLLPIHYSKASPAVKFAALAKLKVSHGIGKNIRAAALRAALGRTLGASPASFTPIQSARAAIFARRSAAQRHRIAAHRPHAGPHRHRHRHPLASHARRQYVVPSRHRSRRNRHADAGGTQPGRRRASPASSSAAKNSCAASGSGKRNTATASPRR